MRSTITTLLGAALVALAAFGALAASSQGAAPSDGLTVAQYTISIDGHSMATFGTLNIVSGFDPAALEVSSGQVVVPTVHAPARITLTRGMTSNIEMSAWHELVLLGDVAAAKKNVSLTALNAAGAPVARWFLTNGWPAKVEYSGLAAGTAPTAGQVLMESVTLVADFVQRISV